MRGVPNLLPSVEYLRQALNYDPLTGVLIWKWRPREHFATDRAFGAWNALHPGKPAGSFLKSGHRNVSLRKKHYRAHRVIWKMMTGEEPPNTIDHQDTDPASNIWENLRAATESQNKCNRGMQKNNTSGLKGVSWAKREGKWRAQIKLNNKNRGLGLHATPEAAHAAYRAAAAKLHGEFARVHTDIVRAPRK